MYAASYGGQTSMPLDARQESARLTPSQGWARATAIAAALAGAVIQAVMHVRHVCRGLQEAQRSLAQAREPGSTMPHKIYDVPLLRG